MAAYPEVYLDEVVENQGKLFDYVAHSFPDSDTVDFINWGNAPEASPCEICFHNQTPLIIKATPEIIRRTITSFLITFSLIRFALNIPAPIPRTITGMRISAVFKL